MHPNTKNILGQRFGRLVVIRRAGSTTNREALWECQCDCGKTKQIRASHLNCRRTISCGCYATETRRARLLGHTPANRKEPGVAALNALIGQYRKMARQRGYAWELPRSECIRLFQSPCYYCGLEPEQVFVVSNGGNGTYTYNGIDRIANGLGYIAGNVVPCCRMCNQSKNARHLGEFVQWAQRLALNLKRRGLIKEDQE